MSRFTTILICLLAAGLSGCFIRPRNMPQAPAPLTTTTFSASTITPPWVVTATQGLPAVETAAAPAGPTQTGGANEPTQASGPTMAPTPLTTDVKAVLVKDDLRLRRGPGSGYDILGLVHAGMMLNVTGKSSDNAWWQVQCDQGPNNICWVSADPELTEPTTPLQP